LEQNLGDSLFEESRVILQEYVFGFLHTGSLAMAKQYAVWIWILGICILCRPTLATEPTPAPKRIVLIAGKPSHPPRMHEFNAGVQLLSGCLLESGLPIAVDISLNGWPKDESMLDRADAIVFYMDGGGGHEAVQESGRRLNKIDELANKGVGIGCMHYAVEIVPDQAGKEFKKWILFQS